MVEKLIVNKMESKEISKFLVELRSQKGVTQQELAAYLGVSNKTISKWETGTSIPDSFYLLSIAKYYDVTVDEILAGEFNDSSENKKISSYIMCFAVSTILLESVIHCLSFLFLSENNNVILSIAVISGIIISLVSLIVGIIKVTKKKNLLRLVYSIYIAINILNLISYLIYLVILIK